MEVVAGRLEDAAKKTDENERLWNLLYSLRRSTSFMRQVTYWQDSPARPARYAPFPTALNPRLLDVLRRQGIERLYTHQATAFEAAQTGRHLVIVTPAASGKTLCYNLPVLQSLLTDRRGRALYLFPTKALAQDQLHELQSLSANLDGGPAVYAYDGDTPTSSRPAIRRSAQILITNPDMLHLGILPHHTQWAEFFSGLRFVVLDELHAYRGVFGSHVANVLRRLRRIASFYNSQPQFICTSATIANPTELASRLTEANVKLISEDGSPKGEKHFIFYNPPLVNRELGIRRPVILDARDIAGRFLEADVQTVVFTRARLTTEILLTYLREYLIRRGGRPESVRGYRGGYLPIERREIEQNLRRGIIRGVVATNALELGIDIGQMSAAVLTGYPGTIASAWQQAGRAGRRAGVSAAIFIASASPLDQYVVQHPDYFFGRSPERALVAPDNLAILLSQLPCATFELPLQEQETFGTYDGASEILEFLAEEGKVRISAGRWHWMSESYPAQAVSLRTASPDTFVILQAGDASTALQTIGKLDRFSVPLLLHEGAIYFHEGQSFLVEALDWDNAWARVRPVNVDYFTEANLNTKLEIAERLASAPEGLIQKGFGSVIVRSKASSFKKIKLHTHEVIGRDSINLPEISLPTSAFWLMLPEKTIERLRQAGCWRGEPISDYGPNWPAQRQLARQRDGFRCTVCGVSETPEQPLEVHHLRPFREFDYLPGQNDHYLAANALDNLVTLCPRCHRLAEAARQLRSTLAGLAYVIRHVAPVFLMCDPHDLGVAIENFGIDGQPTLFIYDQAPAGLGFSQALFDLKPGLLLRGVADVVQACTCKAGCPSCVGPAGELSGNVKEQVLQLIHTVLPEELRS